VALKDTLKSFLVANIASQISTIPLTSQDVYEGQSRRVQTGDSEVWVSYAGHVPIERRTGRLERHTVDITIVTLGYDESNEDALTNSLEDAAEELIAAYDEKVDLFRTNIPASTISWTRTIRGAVDAAPIEKSIVLTLTLDEWV